MDKAKVLLRQYPWVVLFALFIVLYTGFDLTQTNRARSELENRPLKTRPKMTWSALMKGSYDEAFDGYINDQFVLRDAWITLKSYAETLLLKTENNGVLYGKEHYLFGKFDKIDETRYLPNRDYLREFPKKYPEQQMTFMIVPNSYEILQGLLPMGYRGVEETSEIQKLTASLPGNVTALPLTQTMTDNREKELYYRTDHHWSTQGAYLAAAAYAKEKGLSLPSFESLPKTQYPGFLGTYFSKAKKAGQKTDSITLCEIPTTSVTVAGEEKSGLYDWEKLHTRDQYAALLWGNNNFTQIRSQNNQNSAAATTRVLLIKDSFGNCFAPFLTYLYDEVDVLDLRYVQKLSDFLTVGYYDDVLVLYNFESFTTDGHIAKLRY